MAFIFTSNEEILTQHGTCMCNDAINIFIHFLAQKHIKLTANNDAFSLHDA
jgi:hypothetical protein